MRVTLKTLGCRLNEAELETWAEQFRADGHRIVSDSDEVDLVVLNSCAVTQDAVRKSRSLIRRVHRENPNAKLVLSGCYASLNPAEAKQALGVDLVIGNADKERLVEITKQELDVPTMPAFSTEPGETSLFTLGRQRAFVKVQDGCRYRCAFCIVTVARGEERSRPIADVATEINALHEQGIQEAILTGVHLGGWGSELGMRLEDLIGGLLAHTGIPRLRLGSLEPWELTEDFVDLLQNPRLMPHLHLPLQSGSDTVLRRMARRCKTADFAELTTMLHAACPNINITTDIITGFPGETDENWREGLEFIESQSFGHIHIFSYSIRAGTKAAEMSGQVPEAVKKIRAHQLRQIAAQKKQETLARFVGHEFPVLWEEGKETSDGRQSFRGYTPNYLRVEALSAAGVDLCKRIAIAELIGIAEDGDHLVGRLKTGFEYSGYSAEPLT